MISGPMPSPGRRVIWYVSFLETAARGATAVVVPADGGDRRVEEAYRLGVVKAEVVPSRQREAVMNFMVMMFGRTKTASKLQV